VKKLSDCRVLLVDDAKANLNILVEGLKPDHKLSLALNGEMALQIAARTPPDPVLLEVPEVKGRVGYARAVLRLGAFHRRLSATTKVGPPGSISVLLVDSRLWSRLSPDARGYVIATHTAGPQAGDVVVVTHEAVLAELVGEKLSIATALDRGLLVVDGESTAVDNVRSLLNESFSEKKEKSSE
jgi:hypothetical protein